MHSEMPCKFMFIWNACKAWVLDFWNLGIIITCYLISRPSFYSMKKIKDLRIKK